MTTKMKKFAGTKKLATIKVQCKAAGIHFNDILFKEGSDYVVITTKEGDNRSGQVLFNTFNGTFFGTTPEGVSFDSSTAHENEPWFQALLAFFYFEVGLTATGSAA